MSGETTRPVLVRGGLLADGISDDLLRADLRLAGDRIIEIGPDLEVEGAEVIDAGWQRDARLHRHARARRRARPGPGRAGRDDAPGRHDRGARPGRCLVRAVPARLGCHRVRGALLRRDQRAAPDVPRRFGERAAGYLRRHDDGQHGLPRPARDRAVRGHGCRRPTGFLGRDRRDGPAPRAGSRRGRRRDVDGARVRARDVGVAGRAAGAVLCALVEGPPARVAHAWLRGPGPEGARGAARPRPGDRRRHARLALPRAGRVVGADGRRRARRGSRPHVRLVPLPQGLVDPRARRPAVVPSAGRRRADARPSRGPCGALLAAAARRRLAARDDLVGPGLRVGRGDAAPGRRRAARHEPVRGRAPPAGRDEAAGRVRVRVPAGGDRALDAGARSAPCALRRLRRSLPRRPPAPAWLGHVRPVPRRAHARAGRLVLARGARAPLDDRRAAVRADRSRDRGPRGQGRPRRSSTRRTSSTGPRTRSRARSRRASRRCWSTGFRCCGTAVSRARCPAGPGDVRVTMAV